MLTQVEAQELVLRSAHARRRPHADFVRDRIDRRARRLAAGCRPPCRTPGQEDWVGLWEEYLPMAGGASYVNVVLDTTAPAGVTLTLGAGTGYTNARAISAAIATSDSPTTGYQMLIWGSVDTTVNASIQATQGASTWIAYSATQAVTLSTGDGVKTINVQVRDDVWNASSTVTQTITLDTVAPVVTVQAGSPDVAKISKIATKDTVNITWQSDSAYQAYEVAVVATSGAARGTGTVIGSAAGSTNVSGAPGIGSPAPATTNVTTAVKGTDLQTASAADGTKIIKIFVEDLAGNWSA